MEEPAKKQLADFDRKVPLMLRDSSSPTRWKVQVFRVRGALHQRRILSAFRRIGRPGVIALGTHSGRDWFVVVECSSLPTEVRARRVVMTIDPHAVRTYACEGRPATSPGTPA